MGRNRGWNLYDGTKYEYEYSGEHEQPPHEVTVQSFKMWKTEVTAAEYRECVDNGGCTPPSVNCDRFHRSNYWHQNTQGNEPINYITWDQARDFCAWMGGRLPSEAEWEFAARSRGMDINYPWQYNNDDPVYEKGG